MEHALIVIKLAPQLRECSIRKLMVPSCSINSLLTQCMGVAKFGEILVFLMSVLLFSE